MKWFSTLSERPGAAEAGAEAIEAVADGLGDLEPHLLLIFVHPSHAEGYERILEDIRASFPRAVVVGCSAGGVVGAGREVEHRTALSVTAAWLPDVAIEPFRFEPDQTEPIAREPESWMNWLQLDGEATPQFIVLPDPFTCDAAALVRSLDAAFPDSVKVGGLASGGRTAGENAVILGDRSRPDGVVGVALQGNLRMETIVAQGCRPIGEPLFVTLAEGNLICRLEGRPATEVVTELYDSLSEADRELLRGALFVGIVMKEGQQEYGPGDFLIRNVIGMDRRAGVVAVGEQMSNGQVIQFHLRDARTSAEDLDRLLRGYVRIGTGGPPSAALLFSCLGRGRRLYGRPDHDSGLIADYLGGLPIGGFFCNGEIGPVGGRTHLHGYTSSIAMLRPRAAAVD